jgi:hypothetical protein
MTWARLYLQINSSISSAVLHEASSPCICSPSFRAKQSIKHKKELCLHT